MRVFGWLATLAAVMGGLTTAGDTPRPVAPPPREVGFLTDPNVLPVAVWLQSKGYGPPVSPATVVADYERIKRADPSRPVLLNLGQGVAWDQYIGRGTRRNHPEDYPEYLKGC